MFYFENLKVCHRSDERKEYSTATNMLLFKEKDYYEFLSVTVYYLQQFTMMTVGNITI